MQQRVQQLKKLGRRAQKGFTLIELMIVVAIIGILAAIAIPQYQDYVTRARWTENVTSIASLKQAIAECVQNNVQAAGAAAAPCDALGAAGLGSAAGGGFTTVPASKYAASVAYAGGVITITGTAAVGACVVTVTPAVAATSVSWTLATTTCTKAQTGV
ncbi:prepilin-type N-terminal cleavage/methylation domain-containing protein [Cupriavidus sp. CuC1]|uniref:pilin n=1 Tax=Cupriavidus sp. CuC1 TaxID=3373131 RepID=UPI0037CF68D8